MCEVMTMSTPALIAAWKGGRSILSTSARLRFTVGMLRWLSIEVSP